MKHDRDAQALARAGLDRDVVFERTENAAIEELGQIRRDFPQMLHRREAAFTHRDKQRLLAQRDDHELVVEALCLERNRHYVDLRLPPID